MNNNMTPNNINNNNMNNNMIPNDINNNNINNNMNITDMNNFGTPLIYQNNMNLNNNNFDPNNCMNQQNLQNMQNMQNIQNINIFIQQQPQQQFIFNTQNPILYNPMPYYNNINNHSQSYLNNLYVVPMIGLINLGQTCYMNSVLQCMSNLFPITNYFLNPKKIEKLKQHFTFLGQKEDSLLCFAYKELIENLWKGPFNKPYSPIKFKNILQKLNPLFSNNTAGDSKDFFNYLIMQLHNELNGIEINPASQKIKSLGEDAQVDPFNKEQVFNSFMSSFASNYSIITCYFYGVTQGQFECQMCKNKLMQKGINLSPTKYNFESFFYLEFPLDEVRKYVAKLNNNLQYYQNINEVNLYDCFNYHQKLSTIIGYCEKCKRNDCQINTLNLIYSPSQILVLIFNRGIGKQFKVKINFEEKLDLNKIEKKNTNQYYELQGVVKHFGENSANGHFIAYCRSAVPMYHNNWYCYNDQTVTQVNDWKDIIDTGDTYILFYYLKKF
jgi:ubiquitin C-terminal hydrolase